MDLWINPLNDSLADSPPMPCAFVFDKLKQYVCVGDCQTQREFMCITILVRGMVAVDNAN